MADLVRDGVRIHYEISGERNDRLPVLLSHGFGATSLMWAPNLPALAAARTIITWDMRGHGRSDSPASGYTRQACVQDMAAVLDAAEVGRAVVGGLSLGGNLSLAFRLAHAERVAALMLFDTGPGFRSEQARQRWNDQALATARRLEREGAEEPDGRASAVGLARAARGMLTQQDASVIDSLPTIEVPVLVLVGADDRDFLGAADYLAAKIPMARKVVIPDAGHVANADQPALFNDAVLAFLAEIDSPAGASAS